MANVGHDERIKAQIKQYEKTENMHGQLEDIFRYWQEKYFKPRFSEVCRANNHLEFYWKAMAERIHTTGLRDLISFGCGDAQVEVGVASGLKKSGIDNFRFHCVELSPIQIERAKGAVEKAGLADNFVFVEADFNKWESNGQIFAAAMCHHALHHVQDLEHLIGAIRRALHPSGAFISIDVVGRNGHMRWPEALKVIEHIWRFLPDEKKYHHILKTVDTVFQNRDCSTQGFEGICSQDILPLLVKNFRFESFLCFGNLIDIFTSRGFGANFDPQDEHDRAFIDFIEFLNELLIDLGYLKPTRMCAVMVLDDATQPRVYKNWTPEFCIRKSDGISLKPELISSRPEIRNVAQPGVKSVAIDFLVGGMPRGGTTVAAKFMSLHPDIFCYASETHLISYLYDFFRQHPCHPEKVKVVSEFLRSQLTTTMLEIPRFNVSKGAHVGNLIFDESSVNALVSELHELLVSGASGETMYRWSLEALRRSVAKCSARPILGEKTPSNVFAMADFPGNEYLTKPVLVVREPFGALRSMRRRSDPYASAFSGDTESNIGIYLDYGHAITRCLDKSDSLLVRYEEMANDPADVLTRMFGMFGLVPEERVINFVERGRDKEIADRAPMNYRRLTMDVNHNEMTQVDIWKILALTRSLRNELGYTDEVMEEWGLPSAVDWPGDDVPSAILPLGGFYPAEANGHRWMKQQGRLAVYIPSGKCRRVRIDLWSCFPSEIVQGNCVNLCLLLDGRVLEQVTVPCGQQNTRLEVALSEADVQPMGVQGSFAVITLQSSVSFTPMTATADGLDVRDISFLMHGWAIN